MRDDKLYQGDHVRVRGVVTNIYGDMIRVSIPTIPDDDDIDRDDACVSDESFILVHPTNIELITQDHLPIEPSNGTLISGKCPRTHYTRVFVRNDIGSPCNDGQRRFSRHWWDVAEKKWITWPDVILAGGDPSVSYAPQVHDVKSEDEPGEHE